jgi:diaminopimelate epimerase
MSMLSFGKYQGAGNDFIIIDDRDETFQPSLIPCLCHRKFGIGADGVILLQDPFRMRIYNSDGLEAETCGNGLRCLGRFLLDLGFPKQKYRIQTIDRDRFVEISYIDDLIAVDMGQPQDLTLHISSECGPMHYVNIGVPHAVLFVDNVDTAPLDILGPFLRHHPHFQPKGTNANLATLQSDNSIRVRTFERGIEGETLACGTGACAVALIASHLHQLPNPILIHYPGGDLTITQTQNRLILAGPAHRVFEGTI